MKNKLFVLLIIFFFILVANGIAFSCNYNSKPYIESKIYWTCYNITGNSCLSYVRNGNDMIQTNPSTKLIKDFGVIDKFQVKDGISSIYFTNKDLVNNKIITFGVQCGDTKLEHQVTPINKDLFFIADRAIYFKANWGEILLLTTMALIALIIIFFAYRTIIA